MYTKSLYTKCITLFDKQNIYKMYIKCLYTKCILHFGKLSYAFCILNLAGMVPLILYTKCIQCPRNRSFLVAQYRLIERRPNMRVVTKRLLHQQVKILG